MMHNKPWIQEQYLAVSQTLSVCPLDSDYHELDPRTMHELWMEQVAGARAGRMLLQAHHHNGKLTDLLRENPMQTLPLQKIKHKTK
jgi:hypothetical protein